MKSLSVLLLSKDDVVKAGGLDMSMTIKDVENTLSLLEGGKCIAPDKVVLKWGKTLEEESRSGRINGMPGYVGGEYNMAGMKWIGSNPDNPFKFGYPRATALTILNDPETKVPLAILDGTIISAMRTGAVTGVAVKYLAIENSAIVGLIGAGVQNKTQLHAILTVRPSIKRVYIYDINRERSADFAQYVQKEYEKECIVAETAKEAVVNADIFVTATVAERPIVQSDWMKEGAFYSHVGSFECDYETVKKADKRVVDDWEHVKQRAVSTIAIMANEGKIVDKDIHAELGEIINNKKVGRKSASEKIYFNSVGMGIEDVAVATRIYKMAKEMNLGTEFKLFDKSQWI